MDVSDVSISSVMTQASESAAQTRAILVAKKQMDAEKSEAAALVQLVQQASDGIGQRINVYA